MRTITDIKCLRCGSTESTQCLSQEEQWDVIKAHTCVDGGKGVDFESKTRIVPGPGERLRDERKTL